jgi:glycogen debranching enzyme
MRDAVYHQGTVWPWLMGPFVDAWIRVRGGTAEAKRNAHEKFVAPMIKHALTCGFGHFCEIADAEEPYTARGCPFQAWSLGELLRVSRDGI